MKHRLKERRVGGGPRRPTARVDDTVERDMRTLKGIAHLMLHISNRLEYGAVLPVQAYW